MREELILPCRVGSASNRACGGKGQPFFRDLLHGSLFTERVHEHTKRGKTLCLQRARLQVRTKRRRAHSRGNPKRAPQRTWKSKPVACIEVNFPGSNQDMMTVLALGTHETASRPLEGDP